MIFPYHRQSYCRPSQYRCHFRVLLLKIISWQHVSGRRMQRNGRNINQPVNQARLGTVRMTMTLMMIHPKLINLSTSPGQGLYFNCPVTSVMSWKFIGYIVSTCLLTTKTRRSSLLITLWGLLVLVLLETMSPRYTLDITPARGAEL